ncbi:MAG: DUF1232 domain-containing protein [Tistlia sp.]|uniref:DUF1232 domain-containing protein n=1 Tax=Tistlia sp. TaxID=3057121 RepID=UPI0034A5A8E5
MATSKTTSRGRRLRDLPLKGGSKTVRRVLLERRTRVRRGRRERAVAILLALALLAYGAFPNDLVADTRPGVGLLDDLVVLPLGFWLVVLLLERAQRERRLARHVAEGGDPAAAPAVGSGKRRRERLRGAVLIVAGTALGLAAGYLGQQLFPGG